MQHTSVQLDDNGDEIVLRGIHNTTKAWCKTMLMFSLFVGLTVIGLLFIPLILLITYCVCIRKWTLYVTHTDIHYNPGLQYMIVPFSDISEISVMPGTDSILIVKKQGSAFQTGNGEVVTNQLDIDDVRNCKEFVEAVKREMASIQND